MFPQHRNQKTAHRRKFLASIATTSVGVVAGCVGETSDNSSRSPTNSNTTSNTESANVSAVGSTNESEESSGEVTLTIPTQGNPDSEVRVLVFEDFACPHCRDFTVNVAPKIRAEYIDAGDIHYEFHDYPIPVHDEISWEAPCAARAVQATEGDEGFFRYTSALFENQTQLGPQIYEEVADEQGLDGASIRQSAEEREYIKTVRADRQAAHELGIRTTPTVVVGHQAVRPTYEAISTAIERELPGE